MCLAKHKWLVYVEYGETPRRDAELLSDVASTHGAGLVRVRTDLCPGRSLTNPNEAFEFSGYQDGLDHVIGRIKDGNHGAHEHSEDARVEVTFLNDTFFSGHPRMVSKALLKRLLATWASADPAFVGLTMPAGDAVRDLTGLDAYVSTWAFKLAGPLDHIGKVAFFDRGTDVDRFHDQFYIGLPQNYRAHLSDWLNPRGFLRGWYQAIPGKPLADSVRRRKEMTIYLEHALSLRLARLGFKLLDAGQAGGTFAALKMRVLKAADKIFVNSLKLRTRLGYIFAG